MNPSPHQMGRGNKGEGRVFQDLNIIVFARSSKFPKPKRCRRSPTRSATALHKSREGKKNKFVSFVSFVVARVRSSSKTERRAWEVLCDLEPVRNLQRAPQFPLLPPVKERPDLVRIKALPAKLSFRVGQPRFACADQSCKRPSSPRPGPAPDASKARDSAGNPEPSGSK